MAYRTLGTIGPSGKYPETLRSANQLQSACQFFTGRKQRVDPILLRGRQKPHDRQSRRSPEPAGVRNSEREPAGSIGSDSPKYQKSVAPPALNADSGVPCKGTPERDNEACVGGCGSMVERKLPKLQVRVRFPSPALKKPRCQHLTARLFSCLERTLRQLGVAERRVPRNGAS